MTDEASWHAALPDVAREVERYVGGAGWDQPAQLFALVPTVDLLDAEPGLAARLEADEGLTPVAQADVPGDLPAALAGICWPAAVAGCALAQEIVVLPPEAEAELDAAVAGPGAHAEADVGAIAVRTAQRHPDRRDARLVVAVLRDGEHRCVLRVRATDDAPDELIEHPDLAPNMVDALHRTLLG